MKTMNAYRYITAILFSLLIIFAGAGVAVVHCYCVSCRVSHQCCEDRNDNQHAIESSADFFGEEECCTPTIYKIDFLKGSEVIPVMAPFTLPLCKKLAEQLNPLAQKRLQTSFCEYPPSPPEPRRYLALYSVYII